MVAVILGFIPAAMLAFGVAGYMMVRACFCPAPAVLHYLVPKMNFITNASSINDTVLAGEATAAALTNTTSTTTSTTTTDVPAAALILIRSHSAPNLHTIVSSSTNTLARRHSAPPLLTSSTTDATITEGERERSETGTRVTRGSEAISLSNKDVDEINETMQTKTSKMATFRKAVKKAFTRKVKPAAPVQVMEIIEMGGGRKRSFLEKTFL